MRYDVYVWAAPRDIDAQQAAELIRAWEARGGDPAESPFEPSEDVGWFYRELLKDFPELDVLSDSPPSDLKGPIWLQTDHAPPARFVAIRRPSGGLIGEIAREIFGLAAKYDLVLFEPRTPSLRFPLQDMAEHATATFWPSGAIQAAVAGGGGAILAVVAWFLGIPIVSGILIAVGLFLAVGAVYTFIHQGRRTWRRRPRTRG
jgi:hypothetical protein